MHQGVWSYAGSDEGDNSLQAEQALRKEGQRNTAEVWPGELVRRWLRHLVIKISNKGRELGPYGLAPGPELDEV